MLQVDAIINKTYYKYLPVKYFVHIIFLVVTTSTPDYLRSGAYAVASSDGSGSSQAVAQATASSGGDNTLNPGMGGRYTQYPQYPPPKSLGYDPSQLGNYNPQMLTSGPLLGNPQTQPNTPGGMNPYSLPPNWNTKYPGAGPYLAGLNFAPQVSNAQAQAFASSSSAQAQANVVQQPYPSTLQQNNPWDSTYNNMSPGYISAQPPDVPSNPGQTLGQRYYQYGQAYPPQPLPQNSIYSAPVSNFPDYGSAQVQPNLGVRRNAESMQALLSEGTDLENRRIEPVSNEAQQSFGVPSHYLAYPRSAQDIRSNMRAFGPIFQNVVYGTGSIEAQSDLPIYNNVPVYAPGFNVVTQSSPLSENFGFTTSEYVLCVLEYWD